MPDAQEALQRQRAIAICCHATPYGAPCDAAAMLISGARAYALQGYDIDAFAIRAFVATPVAYAIRAVVDAMLADAAAMPPCRRHYIRMMLYIVAYCFSYAAAARFMLPPPLS